ncbi:MAG: class I SAM-dependent methyltransferase [Victivallaceae bacterium]
MVSEKKVKFILPPQDVYEPVTRYDDPLRFYYKPIIGRLYVKRLQDGLALLHPPYERVLDFGYGSGLLFNTLHEISGELHGIDILSDCGKLNEILASQQINAILKKEDILKAGYPAEHFDLIVAFSVFEHIEDFEPILNEMHRILKPGGELLIGMPSVSKTMPLLFKMIGFKNIEDFHVTSHKNVKAAALKKFSLAGSRRLPEFLPGCCGLYFNMLFKKDV